MAIIKNNPILYGASGMFGKSIVFKTVRGKTIICNRPRRPATQSVQQKENRDRFKKASAWAKEILLNPDQKVYYQKKALKLKLPNAYTAAIADYMRGTKIMQVNKYGAKMTFLIHKKDFELAHVDVVVNTDSGIKETRTLPKGESYFWLAPSELNAGVVVMITNAAGVMREHRLLAA